ncbi:hypothetical protein ABIE26_004293 [Pedobacter africanus]|uniref:Uncharacterized protein n=1 Tax=Pedobacter africanus TaxID=151894 RepID=A0ACC6L2S7_9SPHI|nr:LytTR family DNA-binding domain-containing protein [Pedobacter africanus]MDR6785583.1 hypothetical protein [Pedobacter africanus]
MPGITTFKTSPLFKVILESHFSLLNSRTNKIIFIGLVTLISLLFMYTFVPFNINKWYDVGKLDLLKIFSIFSLAGTLTLLFTQFGLRKWLRLQYLTYARYFFFFIAEIMILTFGVLACDWILNHHPELSVRNYLDTFNYTILIAIPPYAIALLILFGAQQYKLARQLSLTATTHKPVSDQLLISDENGKLILTLQPSHVLFFKSEDNYVDVHYLLGGELKKELIRTTLKRIESCCSYAGLIRVHRSYTVNMTAVSSARKTSRGYVIQFDALPDLRIPVSASHQKHFEARSFTPL